MPHCNTCSPWCNRCHRKKDFKFPQECPVCGRFNPYGREVCPKCGTPIVYEEQAINDDGDHLNAEVKKACFYCSPFVKPLCNECLETGRIKICPDCGTYQLGERTTCKNCGHVFEEQAKAT